MECLAVAFWVWSIFLFGWFGNFVAVVVAFFVVFVWLFCLFVWGGFGGSLVWWFIGGVLLLLFILGI